MTDTMLETWKERDRSGIAEIKITPKRIEYIEARGFLCHELLYLLGGHIEFVETLWRQCALKLLEYILPISPICRWFPLDDCILEWVGHYNQSETRAYRLTPREGSITVFFVEYKPSRPTFGRYVRPFYNFPQLDISKFIRPPFEESSDEVEFEQLLRTGLVEKFEPMPMTSEARNRITEIHREMCKVFWEELSK
jgi:hypothetical protein